MKKTAIILAGGSGLRAGGDKPKQLQMLNDKPVFSHSVEAFLKADPSTTIILVVNADHEAEFQNGLRLMQQQQPFSYKTVRGGDSRAASVKNALDSIAYDDNTLTAIHDAARPLVTEEMINRGWEMASAEGSAIPVIPLTDSIRQLTQQGSISVDRAGYKAVQTPQVFRLNLLKQAYDSVWAQGKSHSATDDASVVEMAGGRIHLYDGDPVNIKITGPADIDIARMLINLHNEKSK